MSRESARSTSSRSVASWAWSCPPRRRPPAQATVGELRHQPTVRGRPPAHARVDTGQVPWLLSRVSNPLTHRRTRDRRRQAALPPDRRADRGLDRRRLTRRGGTGPFDERARRVLPDQPRNRSEGSRHAHRQGSALQAPRHRHVRRRRSEGSPPRRAPRAVRRPLHRSTPRRGRTLGLGAEDLAALLRQRAALTTDTEGKNPHDRRHRGAEPQQALQGEASARQRLAQHRRQRHLRPSRSQRRRQDHPHVDPHRPELRVLGLGPGVRRAPVRERARARPDLLRPESQKYPDDAYPKHAFKAASLFFPTGIRRSPTSSSRSSSCR